MVGYVLLRRLIFAESFKDNNGYENFADNSGI